MSEMVDRITTALTEKYGWLYDCEENSLENAEIVRFVIAAQREPAAAHQRVIGCSPDSGDSTTLRLHLAAPITDAQVATLLECLRTWHP